MATSALGVGESLLLKAAGGTGVNYILEIHGLENDKFFVVPMPSQPESIECNRQYAEKATYTFDPNYAFREIGKQRGGKIAIQGRTGLYSRLGLRYDYNGLSSNPTPSTASGIKGALGDFFGSIFADSGGVFYGDGESHLAEFQSFCKAYHEHASKTLSPTRSTVFDLNKETGYASKPFLVFRALKENIHVRVTIDTFTWAKNKDNSRMGNIWTLVLTIYDDYTDTDNPFAIDFIKQQLGNFNRALETLNGKLFLISRVLPNLADQIASPLNQTIKQLNSTISGTRAVVNSPAQAISILKTVVNNVMNTLGNVVDFFNFESGDSFVANDWSTAIFTDGWYGANRLADSTSNFASAYSGLFDSNDAQSIPKDIDLGTSSSALREEALVLEELMYAINIAKGYLNLTKSVLNTAEIGSTGFLNRDERSWGALSALFSTEDNVPKNVKSNLKGISYTLRSGENLLNIAEKLTGSRDGWVVLSEINDCKDAYTRNDGSPLGAGSTILVPVQDNSLAISLLPNTGDDLGSKIGTDFMLDQNGDFVLDGDDLKLVSGVSNLKQAVRNRLQTKKGELVHTPNLGLDEILGNKNLWSISYIAMHIREQLLQDGRFIDIKDIQIEEQADELYVSITAQTIEKKNLTFKTGV